MVILNDTQDSLSVALDTIENFGNSSGLKLNGKKTEGLSVESMVGNKEKLSPEKKFKWPENRAKFLGACLDLY